MKHVVIVRQGPGCCQIILWLAAMLVMLSLCGLQAR